MEDPAQREVVDMVTYLRETIAEIDGAVGNWQAKRAGLAVRLAALEAASDPATVSAADEFEARAAEGRPYEDAEDAGNLIAEARRRYAT